MLSRKTITPIEVFGRAREVVCGKSRALRTVAVISAFLRKCDGTAKRDYTFCVSARAFDRCIVCFGRYWRLFSGCLAADGSLGLGLLAAGC